MAIFTTDTTLEKFPKYKVGQMSLTHSDPPLKKLLDGDSPSSWQKMTFGYPQGHRNYPFGDAFFLFFWHLCKLCKTLNQSLESVGEEEGKNRLVRHTCPTGMKWFYVQSDNYQTLCKSLWDTNMNTDSLGQGHLICWYAFLSIVAKWTWPKFKTNVFILCFYCPPTLDVKIPPEIFLLFYCPPDSLKSLETRMSTNKSNVHRLIQILYTV